MNSSHHLEIGKNLIDSLNKHKKIKISQNTLNSSSTSRLKRSRTKLKTIKKKFEQNSFIEDNLLINSIKSKI